MKILLIEPPFYRLYYEQYSLNRYPLALGYLAGTIKRETDWNVLVYNADFSPDNIPISIKYLTTMGFKSYLESLHDSTKPIWGEIRSNIMEYDPDVVGISAKSQNFVSASIVARLIKEINKHIIVIVGGPHPSMVGPEVLKDSHFDIAVRGEGERTIVEMLKAIDNQGSFQKITGIIFREGEKIIETPPRELICDLDSLCFPYDYATDILKDYEKYDKSCFAFVFATRGCPYDCFFCGSRYIWGRKVRHRSVENVTKEITLLQKRGITSITFDDDTFGVNKEYITKLCKSLSEKRPRINWACELHVNLVNDETVALMKKAGCYSICLGIESGNNAILQKIRKGFTIDKAIAACNIIRRHGIHYSTLFMVGFPWETKETLNDTLNMIKQLESDVFIVYSIFTPYPGTEAFEFCKQNELVNDEFNVALYNHQSPENCFCHMPKQEFRKLLSQIEEFVDDHNQKITRARINIELFRRYGMRKCLKVSLSLTANVVRRTQKRLQRLTEH